MDHNSVCPSEISSALYSAPSAFPVPPKSVGMVTITSSAESASRLDSTGPGRRRWGTLESPSVFPMDLGAHASFPFEPSNFHSHTAPVDESVVVISTKPVLGSALTYAGSEGWVPRSNVAVQMGAEGADAVRSIATTLICSSESSQSARSASSVPSKSTSANKTCVVGRCPDIDTEGEGLGLDIDMSESNQLHNISSE